MKGEANHSRQPALDGLRGLAVLLVVMDHSRADGAGSAGTVGVTVFFVLSGFLITRLLLREHRTTGRVDLRAFICRRVRRLVPALVCLLTVFTVVMTVCHGPVRSALIAGTYLTDLLVPMGVSVLFLEHTWSLSLEEQFYLVWPLALLALRRLRTRWTVWALMGGIAGVTAWRAVLVADGAAYRRVAFAPDTRVDALLAGCLLALIATRLPVRLPGWAVALAASALGTACLIPDVERSAWLLAPVTASAVAVVGWVDRTAFPVLTWPPVKGLGVISYGVYLWHYPIAQTLHLLHVPGLMTFVLTFGLSIAVATLSWRVVEAPILRRNARDRTKARETGDPAGAPLTA